MSKDKKDKVERKHCTFCGMEFINEEFLGDHINKNHLNKCYDNIHIQAVPPPIKRYKHVKCLNCHKKLPKPTSGNPFCCSSCREEYLKILQEEGNKFGMPDTAQYSETYADQYDWNR
ncbi:hypothetical protein MBGDN05_00452 [Thermoplasmatales archaeon SCGC AB-539-N05]|nr:hypothetical protein MBGDN05_00452 [Thermoplasmatales archaeon SCGC AB-539-N05]